MSDEIIDITPVQKSSPQVKKDGSMTFMVCLEKLLLGERCRGVEWEDEGVYVTIKDEKLMIFRTDDKQLHPLTVSVGDIRGMWVIVGKQESLS